MALALIQFIFTIISVPCALYCFYLAFNDPELLETKRALAFEGYDREKDKGSLTKRVTPIYSKKRAFVIALAALSIIGFGYLSYGVLVQLLAWMPYDWRDNEMDMWSAKYIALLATPFVGLTAIIFLLEKISNLTKRLIHAESTTSCMNELQQVIEHIIRSKDPETDEILMRYAEKILDYHGYRVDGDQWYGLIQTINVQKTRISKETEPWDFLSGRNRKKRDCISHAAKELIEFTKLKFNCKALQCPRNDIITYPDSMMNSSIPFIGMGLHTPSDKTNRKLRAIQYKNKLIHYILLADALNQIDALDKYIRSTGWSDWATIK